MPTQFHYETEAEDPPAPYLTARLSNPSRPTVVADIRAKLDTGADITVIPEALAKDLNLKVVNRIAAIGFDGVPQEKAVYAFRIELPNGVRGSTQCLTRDSDHVLLGRDVINHLRLLLDGPAQSLEILE